jgi:RNA polymerase sigma-70 factor (ECF subfamily)
MASMPPASEIAILEAALGGDESAFRDLVEPHRPGLQAHCYQMLGSLQDAEDALQEALLRAWLRLSQFQGRASIRSWLYTIATRTALDLTSARPQRTLPIELAMDARSTASHSAPAEVAWLEPFPAEQFGLASGFAFPEARYELLESVELAFIVAVQHLAPRQRATLLLREVVGFSALETADALGMTVAAVNSALERARAAMAQRCPDPSQQVTLRSVGDERVRDLVTRYMDVIERNDLDGILALLVEDASWAMPPELEWFQGREAITGLFGDVTANNRWQHIATHANGQIAVGGYLWDSDRNQYTAHVIDVLTLRGPLISAVTAFFVAEAFPRFGLPLALPPETPAQP